MHEFPVLKGLCDHEEVELMLYMKSRLIITPK